MSVPIAFYKKMAGFRADKMILRAFRTMHDQQGKDRDIPGHHFPSVKDTDRELLNAAIIALIWKPKIPI